MTTDPPLEVSSRDGILTAHLHWDDESVLLGTTQLEAIAVALRQGQTDGDRAFVLTSGGPDWPQGLASEFPRGTAKAPRQALVDLLGLLDRTPLTTVGALDGHVGGVGLVLALALDLRVASNRVTLSARDTSGQIVPGLALVLLETIGRARTTQFLLLSASLRAQEAASLGLVSLVREEPVKAARSLAGRVARDQAASASYLRRVLRARRELPYDEALAFEAALANASDMDVEALLVGVWPSGMRPKRVDGTGR